MAKVELRPILDEELQAGVVALRARLTAADKDTFDFVSSVRETATVYGISANNEAFSIDVLISADGNNGRYVKVGTITQAAPVLTVKHLYKGIRLQGTTIGASNVNTFLLLKD